METSNGVKWQSFGHEKVKQVLSKQLEAGKFSHAYIFLGPQGSGKRTLALEFAQLIRGQEEAGHKDLDIMALDAAEDFGVERMRETLNFLSYKPRQGTRKVLVLHNADSLNMQSANALLKTLEEPTDSTVIILVAHSRNMPATILSRCQVFYFGKPQRSTVSKDEAGELETLQKAGLANRVLAIPRLAEKETEELTRLCTAWIEIIAQKKHISSPWLAWLRMAHEARQQLKTTANKKFIVERLVLNIPI